MGCFVRHTRDTKDNMYLRDLALSFRNKALCLTFGFDALRLLCNMFAKGRLRQFNDVLLSFLRGDSAVSAGGTQEER